jgi:hypothetical protein
LTIVAPAILLSRLNAFFEAKAVRNRPLARICDAMVSSVL